RRARRSGDRGRGRIAPRRCRRADAAARRHVRPRDPRGRPRAVPAPADRRHGTDAPGGRRRHARRGGVRAVDAVAVRAAGRGPSNRPGGSSVQPVQPDPAAAGALRGTHARLPRRRHDRDGRRGGARSAGVHARHPAPMTLRAVPGTRARLGTGPGTLSVDALIAPGDAERAEADANRWIKSLRHARVDGATFRDRFTHRGDSLWWFAEIYLHKRRIIVRALRALYALRKTASDGAFAT